MGNTPDQAVGDLLARLIPDNKVDRDSIPALPAIANTLGKNDSRHIQLYGWLLAHRNGQK